MSSYLTRGIRWRESLTCFPISQPTQARTMRAPVREQSPSLPPSLASLLAMFWESHEKWNGNFKTTELNFKLFKFQISQNDTLQHFWLNSLCFYFMMKTFASKVHGFLSSFFLFMFTFSWLALYWIFSLPPIKSLFNSETIFINSLINSDNFKKSHSVCCIKAMHLWTDIFKLLLLLNMKQQ